ncbi:DUF5753 domain-containing protein [Streptomyces lydicamycinicus]|uniref:DUF5753 domain-containing protein n=1 Tax=Streptomyces lydicamycinicus TaxID=1546107 RepID=UPI0005A7B6AB|nr:DUF5753 domain-containing protein [Streptomyces lydicamycinicus]
MTDVDPVIRALRADDQSQMGRAAGGMGAEATDRLAALDDRARTIRAWSPLLIPGVLQTSTYAEAAIRARTPSLPPEEVARRVDRRVQRSERFLSRWRGAGDGHAWLLVGEAGLMQTVTTVDAHAAQMARLISVVDRCPRISVCVLPDDASTAGTCEPFSVHALADGQRVGHLETAVGGWYTTRSDDLARLYSQFACLGRWALGPDETRRVIKEWLTECYLTSSGATRSSSSPATQTPTIAYSSPDPEQGR